MRRVAVIFVLAVMTFGLAGCGQGQAPETNSLSFDKEGGITHKIVGKSDQSYYQINSADLESFAAERVAEYCAENGESKVTLETVDEKDGSLMLEFKYASPGDYSEFNHRKLYVGTLTGASEEGYELEAVPFVSTDGHAAEVGYIEDWDAKRLIILETKSGEEMFVNLPGKTLFVNQDAHSGQKITLVGKKGVQIGNQEEEGTTSFSYIIYE